MNRQEFWNIDNVKSFRGHDVRNGEVDMSKDEFMDYLDELYGTVEICGMTYNHGTALEAIDPVAFRCAQGDHESYLQSELEEQLDREDSDQIEFIDGDEYELDEDEEDEE